MTVLAILKDEGYTVDTAESGKEAIAKSRSRVYNLAIVDIRLLDMEGTELLHKIRDGLPRMRKILITGYPTTRNAIEAANSSADAYLLKPFEMGKVLFVIKEQLRKQEEERSFNQEKVAAFIETRVKELEASNNQSPK